MIEHEAADLSGSRFRDVDLTGTRMQSPVLIDVAITDAWVQDLRIEGKVISLTVNGVDVAPYVEQELDRRHPERLGLRARDVAGLQVAWAAAVEWWDATIERARGLPPEALDERVNGEFSFLQTLRHLTFAIDRWITGPVLAEPDPFHPLGQTHDSAEEGAEQGIDPNARPTVEEVLEARAGRQQRVTDLLDGATDEDLRRTIASPNGGTTTLGDCVRVILKEEWWHHQYAIRDLAVLEGRR